MSAGPTKPKEPKPFKGEVFVDRMVVALTAEDRQKLTLITLRRKMRRSEVMRFLLREEATKLGIEVS